MRLSQKLISHRINRGHTENSDVNLLKISNLCIDENSVFSVAFLLFTLGTASLLQIFNKLPTRVLNQRTIFIKFFLWYRP